ncbi:MAG: HD domain-containing protein, partial [Coleofasciculus sp. C2-GNP5-27]
MSATVLPTTYNLDVPDWLQDCLSTASTTYDPSAPDDAALVVRAFEFAYQLHSEQYRASGEPYIAHPVAVAGLLRDLGGNSTMIAAGLLHDVVEDTDVTPDEIESIFGAE